MTVPSVPALPSAARLLAWAGWLLGGLAACLMLLHGLLLVLYPLQVDYGEGVVLHLVDELARGGAIYRDPQAYPWLVCQYGPLYIWLASLFQGLLGVGYAGARLISLASAIGCLALVYAAAHLRGGRRAALCAATVMACSPLVVQWASMVRVDFFGLFLELAGLYAMDHSLLREDAHPLRRRMLQVLAAVLFTAAFFVKQTFIFGMMAATYALWQSRGVRSLQFPASVLALAATPFVLLDGAADGRLFDLMFRYNALPWSAQTAWLWVAEYSHVVAAFALLACIHLARARMRHVGPWGVYLLLTTLTLVGVGRIGAYYNHFLPFQAALAVVTGVALAGLAGRACIAGHALFTLGAALAFTLPLRPTMEPVTSYLSGDGMLVGQRRLGSVLQRAHERVHQVEGILAQHPGPVLAENLGLPVMAGRPAALCDPVTYFVLADLGYWNARPLEEMVRNHAFGVIMLQKLDSSNLRFPAPLLALIMQHYEPVTQVGNDWILLPRPPH